MRLVALGVIAMLWGCFQIWLWAYPTNAGVTLILAGPIAIIVGIVDYRSRYPRF